MATPITFYDVKTGERVTTSNYSIRTTKNGRQQAVARHNGRKLYQFV